LPPENSLLWEPQFWHFNVILSSLPRSWVICSLHAFILQLCMKIYYGAGQSKETKWVRGFKRFTALENVGDDEDISGSLETIKDIISERDSWLFGSVKDIQNS
jgi:hypothetical protein